MQKCPKWQIREILLSQIFSVMGRSQNNEATQKYCMRGIYSATMAYL